MLQVTYQLQAPGAPRKEAKCCRYQTQSLGNLNLAVQQSQDSKEKCSLATESSEKPTTLVPTTSLLRGSCNPATTTSHQLATLPLPCSSTVAQPGQLLSKQLRPLHSLPGFSDQHKGPSACSPQETVVQAEAGESFG